MRWSAASVLFVCCAGLGAQSGWSLQSLPTAPPARSWHNMAYDLGRSVTVMFGAYPARNDTWEWDGTSWTARPLAVSPSPRCCSAFGYDLGRARIVLCCGYNGTDLGETWEFDGVAWTQVATTGPSPRRLTGMAYDVTRGGMLMFGGGVGTSTLTVFNDTWSWNGTAWQQLSPAHQPPARWSYGLCTDFARGRIVLHGGSSDWGGRPANLSDTWEWNGTDWTQIATTSNPGLVLSFGMTFDWVRGVVVLFGGEPATNQTWLLSGQNWIRDPAVAPAARYGTPLAFDVVHGSTVLFGGTTITGNAQNETWKYVAPVVGLWVPFGDGCAGSAGVPLLEATATGRPRIGGSLGLQLTRVNNGPTVFATGFTNSQWQGVPLPAALDAIGMPGCSLQVSLDMVDVATAALGRANLSLSIPSSASLVGLTFFNQALAVDVAANPFGAVVSNAGVGIIGAL